MGCAQPDPYRVLGVSPTATQAEITHAYRAGLRAQHPDTRPASSSRIADQQLQQLLAAYAMLRDPTRRADYDGVTARTATPAQPNPTDPASTGPVAIPVNHRHTPPTAKNPVPPLRAGPVRRHG
ncbi:J domain-containing protein [Mycolicibacterium neworleansense]|uniref:DnaJ domain-containing protein n=1 Tax=Mycolicibacterium neworleansense TaxID=146018 RepID=A0A0H5RSS7_9MYCO|nr:J domain-containing protein [Mycolicibacterium neworleansense]MCV7361481.1 J domain-containing protein [Mycolicibacterium neworleansense]CRZ16831.1 DnaJ domain-containing protein [Mycolicibacterium neworleansense]